MLWETSQQLTNLPPLPLDARRLVAAFLNCDQNINELAEYLSEDFFEVIHKLCDPAIQAWIAAINALKNNERRERALAALDTALTNEHNPSHIRRAATRILRHLELSKSVPRASSPLAAARATDCRFGQSVANPNQPSYSTLHTDRPQEPTPANPPPCHRLAKPVAAEPPTVDPAPTPHTHCVPKTSPQSVPHPEHHQPVPLSAFSARPSSVRDFAALAPPSPTQPRWFHADNSAWPSPPPIPRSPPPAPPCAGSAS